MTIAQPWAVLLALGALPLVAAYLHQRKRKRSTVSSALLFRTLMGPSRPTNRNLARPRHLVSLIVMLIGLAALVAAVSDLRDSAHRPRDFVLVLDTSASMGATDGLHSRTRLDDAIDVIAKAIGTMSAGDRVALITASDTATIELGFTQDHAAALRSARQQRPLADSSATSDALRIADTMASAGNDGKVVLISDGVGVAIPPLSADFEHVPVGHPSPNTGINALVVREADALGLAEVYISLSVDIDEPREAEIALRVDEMLVDIIPVDLPAQGRVDKLHRIELPAGQWVTATLQQHGADALAADDVAATARRGGTRVRVLLVTQTRLSFAAEALRLHPRVDLTLAGPHDTIPDQPYDLAILEAAYETGSLPPVHHVLAMGIEPAALPAPLSTEIRWDKQLVNPEIIRWTYDDPLFRFVDFGRLNLAQASSIELTADISTLIDTEHGPLAVRADADGQQLVYFGFGPNDSDLVLRVGFVNLIANAIEWAAPQTDHRQMAERAALPESESRLDPSARLEDNSAASFVSRTIPDRPAWQWLVLAGLVALAIEWCLPFAVRLRSRIYTGSRAGQARRKSALGHRPKAGSR